MRQEMHRNCTDAAVSSVEAGTMVRQETAVQGLFRPTPGQGGCGSDCIRTRRLEGRGGARPWPVASTSPRHGPWECRRWETSWSHAPPPVIGGRLPPDEWEASPAKCRRTLDRASPKLSDRSSVQHLVQHLTANRGICRSIAATHSPLSQPRKRQNRRSGAS
jgi:hypothetical protein